MAFRILYKTMFQVQLHHSYFLDNGSTSFISMSADQKIVQLKEYLFKDFINVVPTTATQKIFRDHKIVMKEGTDGFTVLNKVVEENDNYKSTIFLDDGIGLTFLLYSNDYLFDNYTVLPKEKNRLYYFSNTKPSTEADPYTYIPLSSSNDLVDQDYLLSEEGSQSIWYSILQENGNADTNPYLELLAEVEESDLTTDEGKHLLNQAIQAEKSKGLLGIIRLHTIGDNNMDLIEIDNSDPNDVKNYLLDPTPYYKLHFDNRKTVWKYIKKSDDEELETSSVQPLTKNGFIEIDPDADIVPPLPLDIEKYTFPNPTADLIKQTTDVNTNITTTYSEIFI
ncbi:hypothetical protein [Aquimarina megaterium]|uniref:hypothetical protein n=1 Tax=Aquimarina megaterium TaxID=1443666 RepID=UPI00111273CF|nr:hypothetical protein [Aquimarina megaterium]